MGTYLIPGAASGLEASDYAAPAPGTTFTTVPGGLLVEGPQTDAELAALYAGFVPTGEADDAYAPLLPPELRGSAAADWVKTAAGRTNAQLDTAFPAGAQRDLAYTVRAVCRALVYLVDRRLG